MSVRRKKKIYGSTRPLAKRLQTIIVLNSSYKECLAISCDINSTVIVEEISYKLTV